MPSLKLAALLFVVDTAVDHGGAQAGVLAEDFRVMVDLYRQFARGRDHQGAHRGGAAAGRRRAA